MNEEIKFEDADQNKKGDDQEGDNKTRLILKQKRMKMLVRVNCQLCLGSRNKTKTYVASYPMN